MILHLLFATITSVLGDASFLRRSLQTFDTNYHDATLKVIYPADSESNYQYFGNAISADGNLVMIGAPGDNINHMRGSVSVFDVSSWELLEYLEDEDRSEGDLFGGAVSLSGWDALVGAHK
jgi:hypothetical protein